MYLSISTSYCVLTISLNTLLAQDKPHNNFIITNWIAVSKTSVPDKKKKTPVASLYEPVSSGFDYMLFQDTIYQSMELENEL